jgi:hypothetical protein
MSLITNGYGLIITKGLGGGICTLISAQFGLICGCRVTIVTPPVGGGGGNIMVHGFPLSFPIKTKSCERIVLITVNIKEKQFRQQFVMDVCNTDKLVSVVNMISGINQRATVTLSGLMNSSKKLISVIANNIANK